MSCAASIIIQARGPAKLVAGYQIRRRQFFDRYLQGTPAPLWMVEGVPQLKKGLDPLIVVSPATKKTIK